MKSHSEMCAHTRALFNAAKAQQLKTAESIFAFWGNALAAAEEFSAGSLTSTLPRFNREYFDGTTWALVKKLLQPFQELGCVECRYEGKMVVGYVFQPAKFEPRLVEQLALRRARAERKKPTPQVVTEVVRTTIIKESVSYRIPPRRQVAPSIAIIVDFPNCVNHIDSRGRKTFPTVDSVDWSAFRRNLSMYHGEALPVERAVLCVNEDYYERNRFALMRASDYFEIRKMPGKKDVDPDVAAEITRTIWMHLDRQRNDRLPVLNIVSGDKDFSRALAVVAEHVAAEGLALRVRITTWESSASRALTDPAQEVIYMEDILPCICLEGSRRSAMRLVA